MKPTRYTVTFAIPDDGDIEIACNTGEKQASYTYRQRFKQPRRFCQDFITDNISIISLITDSGFEVSSEFVSQIRKAADLVISLANDFPKTQPSLDHLIFDGMAQVTTYPNEIVRGSIRPTGK